MEGLTVRAGDPSDAAAAREVVATREATDGDAADIDRLAPDRMPPIAEPDAAFVVAETEDVVGFAQAVPDDDIPEVFWVETVYVEPDWRDEDVRGTLLERLVDSARERGAERLRLTVDPDDGSAREFYGAHGFRQVGKQYDDDFDVDALVYARPL